MFQQIAYPLGRNMLCGFVEDLQIGVDPRPR